MDLVEIDLSKTGKDEEGKGSCFHPDIDKDKFYLIKIRSAWFAGKFRMQWYGWSFDNWGSSGIQLNSSGIERLFEIIE